MRNDIDTHVRRGEEPADRRETPSQRTHRRSPSGYAEEITEAVPWETRAQFKVAALAQGLGLTVAMVLPC